MYVTLGSDFGKRNIELAMDTCAFCDREKIEERIITETEGFFVIASLGQITDGGYVLIVPKRHIVCLGIMSEEEEDQFMGLLPKVQQAVFSEYGEVLPLSDCDWPTGIMLFEHGIAGQTIEHAHFHVAPGSIDFTERVQRDYSVCYEQFKKFNTPSGLPRLTAPRSYLSWCPPGMYQPTFTLLDPENVPPQYFRTVLAEALGRPERANWHNMDPELDKRLYSETVRRLKKYF